MKLYGGIAGRVNGVNARGFHSGNVGLATLGVQKNLLAEERLRLRLMLEADARYAVRDARADGTADPDSGGFLLYATPSVAYLALPSGDLALRLTVQVPVARSLFGAQTERPVVLAGLSYDF